VALLRDEIGTEMAKLGAYPSDFQAAIWLGLVQCSQLDKLGLEGLKQCLHAAEGKPELSASCHVAAAEHTLQADIMMKHRPTVHKYLAKALDLVAGKAYPSAAGVALRVLCLKALAAESTQQEISYLRAASLSTSDVLQTLLLPNTCSIGAGENGLEAQGCAVPSTFAAWLAVDPSHLVARISSSVNKGSAAVEGLFPLVSIDQISRLLDVAVNMLRSKACMVECVPLLWLQYALMTHRFGERAGFTLLLELSEVLDCLSLTEVAATCRRHMGASLLAFCSQALHKCAIGFCMLLHSGQAQEGHGHEKVNLVCLRTQQ
jgi:hypothetical protein